MKYQPPVLIEIGSFEEVTLGSKNEDTADESSHRW
ncbi:lasso RiPP family leader peptide-containing protein [Polycladospora coralii]|nr:lasso RiPP family leader peptide-containing protein [Polycladospora coralii]